MSWIGYIGYYHTHKANKTIETIYKDNLLTVEWLNDLRNQVRANQANLLELIIIQDCNEQKKNLEDIDKRVEEINKLIANYERTNLTPYEKEHFLIFKEKVDVYREKRKVIIGLATSGKIEEALAEYKESRGLLRDFTNELKTIATYKAQEAEKVNRESIIESARVEKTVIGIVLATIVLALALGWLIAKLIADPLKMMVGIVEEVAKGNLGVKVVSFKYNDEIGHLGRAFGTMITNLCTLVQQVTASAEQVTETSKGLSSGADEAASASDQISNSLQEIAAGAENSVRQSDSVSATTIQISAAIEEVAANTQSVASNAKQAASSAESGSKEINHAVAQMDSISSTVEKSAQVVKILGERSQEIGQIVETITAIADQTNLLALNAAIEAARAGEQGRGFAVVAEEVRKLAEQSGQAAREIVKLIKSIQGETATAVNSMEVGTREVKIGLEVVNRAGKSFQEILQSTEEVALQVQDISAAMEEMAAGTNNLVDSINGIGEDAKKSQSASQEIAAAAQEQNASIEEIASSADVLAGLAENLKAEVAKFTV